MAFPGLFITRPTSSPVTIISTRSVTFPLHHRKSFEEGFYKLKKNNSCYGKTLESRRKRVNLHFVRSEEEVKKQFSKHLFREFKIIYRNLAALILRKRCTFWNKATFMGAAFLDLAKYLMYDFHYNVMRKRFDCRLFHSGFPDSLLYQLQGNEFQKRNRDQ